MDNKNFLKFFDLSFEQHLCSSSLQYFHSLINYLQLLLFCIYDIVSIKFLCLRNWYLILCWSQDELEEKINQLVEMKTIWDLKEVNPYLLILSVIIFSFFLLSMLKKKFHLFSMRLFLLHSTGKLTGKN